MQDTARKREYTRYYKTDNSMQDTTRQTRVCKILQDGQEYARYNKTNESMEDTSRQARVCRIQ